MPLNAEKIFHSLTMENIRNHHECRIEKSHPQGRNFNQGCCQQDSSFTFDQIFFRFAGNQERHKILNKFKIFPDWIIRQELFALEC